MSCRRHLASVCFLTAIGFPSLAQAVTSAEVYTAAAHGYGRFEARLQFAAGDGVVASFFTWKDGSEVAGNFWNELDFEKLGADCHVELNAIYGNPSANHIQKLPPGDSCGTYHTYAYEWTPDSIAWLIDGVEIRRDTGATAAAFADNAASGMQLRFNVWPGDASFGGNFSPDILPVHQYIDWVQFSSYDAGNFTLAWREDFDGATLPTGWATANWGSPKNLSTHDPRNVNLIDGYLVLSLTADDATGPAGAVPEAAGSGGQPGAGGAGGMDGGGTGMTAGTGTTAGSGGTSDAAGSPGTGGSAAGSPGSAGSAAASVGGTGTAGSGGASGSGGTPASGGAAAFGGSASTTAQGGSTGIAGTSDSGGSGNAAGEPAPADGGCSIGASGTRHSRVLLGALGVCAILLGRRSRASWSRRRRVLAE